jgi:hypothetical protein
MKMLLMLLVSAILLSPFAFARQGADDTSASGSDDDGTLDQGTGDASGTDNSVLDNRRGAIKPEDNLRNKEVREKLTADRIKERETLREKYKDTKDCNSPSTAKERVLCNMNVDKAKGKLADEECRREATAEGKKKCLDRKEKAKLCQNLGEDKREACLKRVVGLNAAKQVRDEIKECTGTEATQCTSQLKGKVYEMIKERISNLGEKAKKFADKGIISQEKAADFIAWLEDAKERFANAPDIKGKREVVQEIKNSWGEFVSDARANYKALKNPSTDAS